MKVLTHSHNRPIYNRSVSFWQWFIFFASYVPDVPYKRSIYHENIIEQEYMTILLKTLSCLFILSVLY